MVDVVDCTVQGVLIRCSAQGGAVKRAIGVRFSEGCAGPPPLADAHEQIPPERTCGISNPIVAKDDASISHELELEGESPQWILERTHPGPGNHRPLAKIVQMNRPRHREIQIVPERRDGWGVGVDKVHRQIGIVGEIGLLGETDVPVGADKNETIRSA